MPTKRKVSRAGRSKTTPGSAYAMPKLRACPFCGGKMEVRVIASLSLFGAECLSCGALAPMEQDYIRAALMANRRTFRGVWENDPLDDPPRPALDAAYWWARINDADDVCEFRVVHDQHGPGYWASGAEALHRKIAAIEESADAGWKLDFRSLLHGESSNFTLEQAKEILAQ